MLTSVGKQAKIRYRYHRAAQLYQQAANYGDSSALTAMADLHATAGDHTAAKNLYREAASRGNPQALYHLGDLLERAGDLDEAEALYQRAADGGDTSAISRLGERHHRAGIHSAEAFIVVSAYMGETYWLEAMAEHREKAGDRSGAEMYHRQLAEWVNPSAETRALWGYSDTAELVRKREQSGDQAGAEAVAMEAADDGDALTHLASLREKAGDRRSSEALYRQAVDRGSVSALHDLARRREEIGDQTGAEALYLEAATRGSTSALHDLSRLREQAGDADTALRLRRFGLTDEGEPANSSAQWPGASDTGQP